MPVRGGPDTYREPTGGRSYRQYASGSRLSQLPRWQGRDGIAPHFQIPSGPKTGVDSSTLRCCCGLIFLGSKPKTRQDQSLTVRYRHCGHANRFVSKDPVVVFEPLVQAPPYLRGLDSRAILHVRQRVKYKDVSIATKPAESKEG